MECGTTALSDQHPDIGLLIVHGIGEQKVGETAGKLVEGLSSIYGDRLAVTRDDSNVPIKLCLDERSVRLYEVYWADILSADRVKSTFRWEVIRSLGWFPWLNWKAGLLRLPSYSKREAVAWSVFLVPITLTLQAIYLGARLIAQSAQNNVPEVNTDGLSGWAKWRAVSEAYADHGANGRTMVEDLLDAFAGDVTNYMASLGRTEGGQDTDWIGGAGGAILDRFYLKLAEAIEDGCGEIQILSHSLGTVVAYHGLTGHFVEDLGRRESLGRSYDPISRLTRLYTIGSPLEKIRFFWPTSISESLVGRFTVVDGHASRTDEEDAPPRKLRWDNFHHRFDVVSGRLRRFEHWGGVRNHALKGGGGLMRSHVVYELSPEFLANITEGLFGEQASPEASRASRLRDQVLSTLENLAVPTALALLLTVGLLLCLTTLLIPGYMFSIPFRLIGSYEWAHIVQNVVTILFTLVLSITMMSRPFREARRLHDVWTSSARHPYLERATEQISKEPAVAENAAEAIRPVP